MEQPIVHEPPQVFEQGPPSPTAEERQFFFQQGPPSPTAEEREFLFRQDSPSPTAEERQFFHQQQGQPSPEAQERFSFLMNQDEQRLRERQELRRLLRAGSVPPVLPSYDFRLDDDEHVHQYRAATVEPQYNPQPSFMPQQQHRFRPILEEEEIIPQPIVAPPPIEEEEEEEEDDENVEEFEGVLEAIGMQGSLWTLVQNSSLMGLLIALGLGVAVWIPYLFGMLFIITDIIQLLFTPIQLLTDPILRFFLLDTDMFKPLIKTAFHRYQEFAVGQSATDRVACIAVGYMIITALSCWYMAQGSPASLGRTAQEALRHQGIITKVGTIITIELVVFPLICGYLLDISTKPLFNNTAFGEFTYLSVFFHWAFGTAFMFMFAVLVTVCRDVVRPGVMWFIRDPNDPEFHPIREMVERPIMYQFRKIFMSLVIYTAVIIVGVGGTVHLVNKHVTGLFPIKWNSSQVFTTSNV